MMRRPGLQRKTETLVKTQADAYRCKKCDRALSLKIWKLNIKLPVGNTHDNKQRLANHMNCGILNRLYLIFQEVHRVHGEKRKELLSSQSYTMKIKVCRIFLASFFFLIYFYFVIALQGYISFHCTAK